MQPLLAQCVRNSLNTNTRSASISDTFDIHLSKHWHWKRSVCERMGAEMRMVTRMCE
jgi:hypothetical protein